MPVFVSSKTSATVHGAFAIEQTPPTQILAVGTDRVAIVGQFPWGPKDQRFEPGSIGEAKNTMAPPGFNRTNTAYLSLVGKSFPRLVIVRVLGTSSAAATATLASITPTNILTLPAKYHGTTPNSGGFSAVVANASDGDANHFNVTTTCTSASGKTEDLIENWNYSGTGADSVLTQAQLDALLLVGHPVKLASGRPVNGTYTFSGGSNGTINSAAYLGTAGTGDLGMALLEGDNDVAFFITDDPGNSLRAAVNEGGEQHAILMGDRVFITSGNSGQSASAARTDAASYNSSDRVIYLDPWVYMRDDTTQAEQLVPGQAFAAAMAAQTSPSTSIAWKADEQQAKLVGITRLEFDRGIGRGTNTAQGVATWLKEATGGHTLEAAVLTIAPVTPAKRDLHRRRILDYCAISIVRSIRGMVDAPNVDQNREDIDTAIKAFLGQLKRNQKGDPNHTPFILDFLVPDLSAANTDVTIAQGEANFPVFVQYATAMEKIFILIGAQATKIVTPDQPNG